MPHPKANRLKPRLLTTAALLASLAVTIASQPPERTRAFAHQVEFQDDVGATLHIEPSDTPRAGEEVLAWFALTRKGGQTIPLADCDCTLAVSVRSQTAPTLEPPLKAVEAGGYAGIPGATFTFPDVGAYTLILTGIPKQADGFTPFELDFEVTVAAGEAVPRIPEDEDATLPVPTDPAVVQPSAQPPVQPPAPSAQSPNTTPGIAIALGSFVLLGIVATLVLRSRQKS